MRTNSDAIVAWARTAAVGSKPFTVTYRAASAVGDWVVRATGQLQKMARMVVVPRRIQQQNRVYFLLTSYPLA